MATIRTLRHLPDDAESIARLDVSAGATRGRLIEQFLAAVADLVTEDSLAALRRALTAGSNEAAIEVLDWQAFDRRMAEFIDTTAATVGRGVAEGLRTLPATVAPTERAVAADLAAQEARNWARSLRAADLVRQVRDETKAGIREILRARFEAQPASAGTGIAARRIVDVLRADQIGPLAGLTQNQAKAVVRATARLLGPEPDPIRAANVLNRLAARAVKRRAKVIAHTEAYNAINRGKQVGWMSKVVSGELDPQRWWQEWVSRLLDTTCPRCEAFDGKHAPFGGTFTSDLGEVSTGPLAHPSCQCVARVVRRLE